VSAERMPSCGRQSLRAICPTARGWSTAATRALARCPARLPSGRPLAASPLLLPSDLDLSPERSSTLRSLCACRSPLTLAIPTVPSRTLTRLWHDCGVVVVRRSDRFALPEGGVY